MLLKKKNIMIILEIVLGIHKSIYINFKYLPLKQAIKLPILVSKYCTLLECSGKIIINSDIKTGMILIGVGNVGLFDKKSSRSVIEFSDKSMVIFNGKARFGNGIKICSDGYIEFGNKFTITAQSSIYCTSKIKFGDDVLISWENLIMDSDIHTIYKNKKMSEVSKPIEVGNNVWIGCRCTILKGVRVQDNSVIASNSLLNKSISDMNVLVAGQPAKVIEKNIEWIR